MRVLAMLAVTVVAASANAACAARSIAPPTAAPIVTGAGIRFVLLRADARSVSLAGSFNQWSASSHPLLRQSGDGLWAIVVPLPPGEHTFMYVVNGTEWVSPPMAEDYVGDGFGAKNGIVVVRR
jgi:1,4-alpha-glucan branching enzyme